MVLMIAHQFLANPTDKMKNALSTMNSPTLYDALITDRASVTLGLFQGIQQLMQVCVLVGIALVQ